jgi:hypothetical protein
MGGTVPRGDVLMSSDRERRAETPAPKPQKKRFRLLRLEERVAPKGHFNPKSKWVGGSVEPSSFVSTGGY